MYLSFVSFSRLNLEQMLSWLCQLLHVKLALLKRRHAIISLRVPMYFFCLIYLVCVLIFLSQVPLYKHIADLSSKSKPVLPVPSFTVISGGKHAGILCLFKYDCMLIWVINPICLFFSKI